MYQGLLRLCCGSLLEPALGESLSRASVKLTLIPSVVIAFILLSVPAVLNGQSPQTEATSLIAEAKSLVEKREPERALAAIQEAISLDSRNPVAHVQLAIIYSTLGNEEKARLAVAEALRLDPNYAPAHQQRAAQLRRAKDYEGAVRAAKLALSLKPDAEFESNAHLTLGLTFDALKRYREAADEFREVIRINPNDGYAYDSLSRALFEMRYFQEAEVALRRAIELTPQNTSAYHNLAAALHNQGKVEEAIRYYEEYLRLEPKVEIRSDVERRIAELKAAEQARLGRLLVEAGRAGDATQINALLQKGADVNSDNYVTPLSAVAGTGRMELVKLLLARGAKDDSGAAIAVAYEMGFNEIEQLLESTVNKPRSAKSLNRVLLVAARKGDITRAQAMLIAGADEKDRALDSALDQKTLNAGMVRLLLDKGANVNPTGVKRTPLMLAAYQGDVEVVKLLLAKGANVNARGRLVNDDRSPLALAVEKDHRETVKILIAAGADATDKQLLWLAARAPYLASDDPRRKTAWRPNAEILRLLLDKGAKVSGPDGDSALSVANSADKVKLLLANGANLNAKGQYGGTALHAAAIDADFERITALLKAGAEVNARDSYGDTALLALLYKRDDEKEAQTPTKDYARAVRALLRNKSADVNAKNEDGETPLMRAVRLNNPEVVRLLLAAQADTNEMDDIGDTAFTLAYALGNAEIEKLLIEAGPQRLTPKALNAFLVAAILKKDLAKVRESLDNGADPNHKYSLGLKLQGTTNTVLVLAAKVGDASIVQMLLDKGADAKAKGLLGGSESGLEYGTALEAARDPEVQEVLRQAMNKKN